MLRQEIEARDGEVLIIDVAGYEGPLDVLLELARKQKVDLRKISVLRLVRQYAEFIENTDSIRMEQAAEYLVMAAWLALIKSRLLIPETETGEPSGEELAARLAFRLQRLDAMRKSARRLMERNQLGKEFFARGMPENLREVRHSTYQASLLELMQAYARMTARNEYRPFEASRRRYMAVQEASRILAALLPGAVSWSQLTEFLPKAWLGESREIRSALAAIFAAALELARSNQLTLRQATAFAPIEIKEGSDD